MKRLLDKVASKDDIERLVRRFEELASKGDVEKLKDELKELEQKLTGEIRELRSEMYKLKSEFNTMLKWNIGLLATMWITIVVGIIIVLMIMAK